MYGEGVSKVGELIDLGVQAGIIEKSAAWFSYDSQRICCAAATECISVLSSIDQISKDRSFT